MTTETRRARADAFKDIGGVPQDAPAYRPNMSMGLWLSKYFPRVARWRKKLAWDLGEQLDGPFDASDLLPPGIVEPARYPAYYFMKPVHTYPEPGPIHNGYAPFIAAFNSTTPFYFITPESVNYWVKKAYGDVAPKRALDLGCGIGTTTFEMAKLWPECEVIGIDLSPSCLRWARRHADELGLTNVHFYHRDAGDLSIWDDESFDVVNESYMLHEVPLYQGKAIVREMIRLAKPGATITWFDWPPAEGEADLIRRQLAVKRGSEPFMLQYLDLRLEQWLPELGIQNVERIVRVGANMLVRGTKPAAGTSEYATLQRAIEEFKPAAA